MVDGLKWTDIPVGMTQDELASLGLSFERKEWDLGSERFTGMRFSELVPHLVRESRFHPTRFTPPKWIADSQGGIFQANFKIYKVNPHEQPGQIRQTGSGGEDYWITVGVGPDGQLDRNNPLKDPQIARKDFVTALVSRVLLNNLSSPGSFGGDAHFPLLDIVHPPTPENVRYLVSEIKGRCGLEKFFVLRSSERGMMVVGPELIDEENFIVFLFDSLLLNHLEVANDLWVDDRWVARSTQNFISDLRRLNSQRYGGILRVTALPSVKPEEPVVIAASF